jgi:hypothetical protein
MPMFTAHENVAATKRLACMILELFDADELPTAVAANAVLNVLAAVVVENAARRGADPLDDAANLCTTVKLNLQYPRGLS